MQITKTSRVSGTTHTREINVTADQIDAYNGGALIQDAFPHLSADDREFILTGTTPEEWDAIFGSGDDGNLALLYDSTYGSEPFMTKLKELMEEYNVKLATNYTNWDRPMPVFVTKDFSMENRTGFEIAIDP